MKSSEIVSSTIEPFVYIAPENVLKRLSSVVIIDEERVLRAILSNPLVDVWQSGVSSSEDSMNRLERLGVQSLGVGQLHSERIRLRGRMKPVLQG